MSFLCDCKRVFYSKKKYNRHRKISRIHRPELNYGPFKCQDCPRRLPERYRMEDHQRSLGHRGITEDTSSALRTEQGTEGLHESFNNLRLVSDLYDLRKEDIGALIAETVQADSNFRGCCGEVINMLVRSLQKTDLIPSLLTPRRILKSGSLGKGTAVKNRSDIDLVLMLQQYKDVTKLMADMDTLLCDLKTYLDQHTEATTKPPTRFSVPAVVKCRSGHEHDVDILPAVDLLELGHSSEDVYNMMQGKSADMIHEFSVSLAPLQLEIIGGLPAKVKDLIKLLKYWKNEKLKRPGESELSSFADRQPGDPKWPSSYALELVVMNIWLNANEPINFDMTTFLRDVLRSLLDHGSMSITFPRKMKYSHFRKHRSPPYIMDPANPYNDMYHGLVDGKAFDWHLVAREARIWLGTPLFAGTP